MKLAVARIVAMFAGVLALGIIPNAAKADTNTVTVDGRDYPVCSVEDCSDQPNQMGVWFNEDGSPFLSLGERSIPVIP